MKGRECLRQEWNKAALLGVLAVGVLQLWLAIGGGGVCLVGG